VEAVVAKDGRDGGFAAAEAAGEADTQHTSPIRTHAGRLCAECPM
jgi:hypothetical protein